MREDERLIWELKRGNKEALRSIYEQYKDRLLTVAFAMVHDAGIAEDVLHDVFVTFAAGVGHLDIRCNLRKYLVASIANRIRDIYRKKRLHAVDVDGIEVADSRLDGPDEAVGVSERTELLSEALGQLPAEQRETIVLHINGGMKFKEIAAMQDISTSTVQGRYRYGLEKLRNILDGKLGT
jgi:RNA polymerase sigma-70 factor (ECF subfamily)